MATEVTLQTVYPRILAAVRAEVGRERRILFRMGFELHVFTSFPVGDDFEFPNPVAWRNAGSGWVCGLKDWQVVVGASEPLDDSEVNAKLLPDVRRLRPDAGYRLLINIEGRQSSEAFAIAFMTAQRLAHRLSGALRSAAGHARVPTLGRGACLQLSG